MSLLIEQIAKAASLEEAAKLAANNWRGWNDFHFFAKSNIPAALVDNVTLFYVVTHESGLLDRENQKSLERILAPYYVTDISKFCAAGSVCEYSADFHGDKNLFRGFCVLVYDEQKQITEGFKTLYTTLQEWRDKSDDFPHSPINKEGFEKAHAAAMLLEVTDSLRYWFGITGNNLPEHIPKAVLDFLWAIRPGLTLEDLMEIDLGRFADICFDFGDFEVTKDYSEYDDFKDYVEDCDVDDDSEGYSERDE